MRLDSTHVITCYHPLIVQGITKLNKLNKNLKKPIIKSMIWSVVLYGSETWTMRKEDIKRLEVIGMWIKNQLDGTEDK